jgi:hypothetical protein
MPTNLDLDDDLISEAQRLGSHKTKKDAVTHALKEYVRLLKQREVISSFGTVDFDPAYDYKRERKRKRF